jgi:cullin-4
MLTKLGHYSLVEKALNQATESFYRQESEEKFAKLDVSDFLIYAAKCLHEENIRGEWLFSDAKGRHKDLETVQNIVIKTHAQGLIEGLPPLLDQDSLNPTTLLYRLLKRVNELPLLRSAFGRYIIAKGEALVQEKEKDDFMIEKLLEYKTVIDKTVAQAFDSDSTFRQTQKESFETFVNKRENKPAELIAKFLDARLRSGNKTMSDQELEHVLNEALILFRYTQGMFK